MFKPRRSTACRRATGLSRWIVIDDDKISNYETVVPSPWNVGPRDPWGQPGACEAPLKGHALHDWKQRLEMLRTIHSFVGRQ